MHHAADVAHAQTIAILRFIVEGATQVNAQKFECHTLRFGTEPTVTENYIGHAASESESGLRRRQVDINFQCDPR